MEAFGASVAPLRSGALLSVMRPAPVGSRTIARGAHDVADEAVDEGFARKRQRCAPARPDVSG